MELSKQNAVKSKNTEKSSLDHLERELEILDLSGCYKITDTGLAHVKEFEALRSLLLGNCNKITDFGLAHLKEVKSLQYLGLGNCMRITSAGIKNFKQSRNSLYPIIVR